MLTLKLPAGGRARTLARKTKYVDHIEKLIGEGEFQWSADFAPKAADDAWHPSGDCTLSLHDLYLKATGKLESRGITVPLRKTFANGHFWHAYLQELTIRAGMCDEDAIERRGLQGWGLMGVKQADVRYYQHISDPILWAPYHWATGSGDVAPCEIPGYGPYLVDYKSMNDRDFNKPEVPGWVADKWECQVNIYMDWFNLEHALIIGIQKGTPHEFREIEYERNQPLIDAIYEKWGLVSECIDAEVEPSADLDVDLPLAGPVAYA